MDADGLRDRIRDALAGHQIGTGYYATAVTVAEADEMAQEVIDDLGLTVEGRFVYATVLQQADEPINDGLATRVVGRWEESE